MLYLVYLQLVCVCVYRCIHAYTCNQPSTFCLFCMYEFNQPQIEIFFNCAGTEYVQLPYTLNKKTDKHLWSIHLLLYVSSQLEI